MIREPILFRPFFSLLLLLLFSPFCTYEPTSQIHPKEFRTLIANEESLDALLEIKGRLEDYLPEEGAQDQRARDYLWREVLWAIWGPASENNGGKVLKAAPEEWRERYQKIFE